jgi:hypothetical protein
MPDTRPPVDKKTEVVAEPARADERLWTGPGLCPEAQGDGVPCEGTEGECERCGRALPLPPPDTR